MSNWSKSVIYGGIYAKTQPQTDYSGSGEKATQKLKSRLKNAAEIAKKGWEKTRDLSLSIKNNLKSHISQKQEIYWPVFIAILLMLFVFASRIASAKDSGAPNNLPLEGKSKLSAVAPLRNKGESKLCATDGKNVINTEETAAGYENNEKENLKQDIAGIVENTPMAAMIDPISEKDRTVAAFIVGIAMKESKFGVYSPHIGGRDCYNYWGFKGGGKTVAGGYTCFSSPDEAVDAVGKRIEKMVNKGVRNPAQAIGWKCGSSCAGHSSADVRKWIADVGVNFYKLN